MSDHDDLSPLQSELFSGAITKLEDLMSEGGRAFLLGAGCSKCAGLPLTGELTDKALKSEELSTDTKKILKAVQTNFDGADYPNIEDFLSELVDLIAIADRRVSRGVENVVTKLGNGNFGPEALHIAAEEIKRAISGVINKPINIEYHHRFIHAVHRPFRPGRASCNSCVDYLILNYDPLIETALALGKVTYADGLEGGAVAWWNPETFNRAGLGARVLKLHGSIDWSELPSEVFPRRIPPSVTGLEETERKIMIWPASTKYRETQRDPYSQLSNIARQVLRPAAESQRVLVICGYSFGDSHINLEVAAALRESQERLTVVAFYPEDELAGELKSWHQDPSIRDQLLIYGKRGFWHGDEVEKSTVDLPWWKFENVVRILEGER